MEIVGLHEYFSQGQFILSQELRVVVDLLEELSGSIELVENDLLLSLEFVLFLPHALVVVDLTEARVLPDSGEDLALLIGNVVYVELGQFLCIVKLVLQCSHIIFSYHIFKYIIIITIVS